MQNSYFFVLAAALLSGLEKGRRGVKGGWGEKAFSIGSHHSCSIPPLFYGGEHVVQIRSSRCFCLIYKWKRENKSGMQPLWLIYCLRFGNFDFLSQTLTTTPISVDACCRITSRDLELWARCKYLVRDAKPSKLYLLLCLHRNFNSCASRLPIYTCTLYMRTSTVLLYSLYRTGICFCFDLSVATSCSSSLRTKPRTYLKKRCNHIW